MRFVVVVTEPGGYRWESKSCPRWALPLFVDAPSHPGDPVLSVAVTRQGGASWEITRIP